MTGRSRAGRTGRYDAGGRRRRHGRWLTAVLGLVALASADAGAFKIDYHVEITLQAANAVAGDLPAAVKEALQRIGVAGPARAFSVQALREITDANKAKDLGDCAPRSANVDAVAIPCLTLNFELPAALAFLAKEPAADHFDNETIEVASDQVYSTRLQIRRRLLAREYVAARKLLGGALHGIQDFYAHSNWIELKIPGLDDRLGTRDGYRNPAITPRLAPVGERTCRTGDQLMTTYLTSGYFFVPSDEVLLAPDKLPVIGYVPGGFGDIPEITQFGKCRHGWDTPVHSQPGINKDAPGRPGYLAARDHAARHSVVFLNAIIADVTANGVDCVDCVLGLLGYEPAEAITGVTVLVPGAPNGDSWDSALGGILSLNLKGIQPDVLVCVESANLPGTCAPVCDDTDWDRDLNAYVCSQPLGPSGYGALIERDLRVLVREVDLGEPRRVIASFRVEDPRKCDPYCSLDLGAGRTISIRFKMMAVGRYGGRRRAVPAVLPAAATVPEARPAGGRGATVPAAPLPATPPSAGPPSATASRSGGADSAARRPSAESLGASLRLRDKDRCAGADAFYPAAPAALGRAVGAARADQLYQMAAFSMAIADPAAKSAVLGAIRSRVGDDQFFAVMGVVLADPLQSEALVAAYRNTASNVARQIGASGLTSLLAAPKPPAALAVDVDHWIQGRLASPALVDSAVDMMSMGARPLTAECTLNELAKQGFTDAVGVR